jgi:hypothetical protein
MARLGKARHGRASRGGPGLRLGGAWQVKETLEAAAGTGTHSHRCIGAPGSEIGPSLAVASSVFPGLGVARLGRSRSGLAVQAPARQAPARHGVSCRGWAWLGKETYA